LGFDNGHRGGSVAGETPADAARRLSAISVGASAFLIIAAAATLHADKNHILTSKLFVTQDLPLLCAITASWAVLLVSPWLRRRLGAALGRLAGLVPTAMARRRMRAPTFVAALALACFAVCVAGAWWSYAGFPFSIEEYLANFDAEIFRHGAPMAAVDAFWRPFVPALQPIWMLKTSGNAYWVSTYLPVAALFRAMAGSTAAASLVNPLWAAVSVIAAWGVAGRMWPRRPQVGLAAAMLLASSSQFLVNGMTSYAMPSHLALNLVWLWLFLRGGKLGHAGAVAVGFAACGLHQLVLHPLFAAPFVLQLWLERRWRTAVFYTAAYAAICFFWVSYWTIALRWLGAAEATSSIGGAGAFVARTLGLIAAFDLTDFGLMAMNLIRFVTWQNPLMTPLFLLGVTAAIKAKGTLRSLALGVILTTAAMGLILAFQGYGWGYRYLHGFMGSTCLIAAWTWWRLVEPLPAPERKAAWAGFAAVAAGSVLILLPIRLWQVADWTRPYAVASAAIAREAVDVVIVDENGVQFGRAIVRNDPYLRRRPIVLDLAFLSEAQVRTLCARYSISLFDRASAAKWGVPVFKPERSDADAGARSAAVACALTSGLMASVLADTPP